MEDWGVYGYIEKETGGDQGVTGLSLIFWTYEYGYPKIESPHRSVWRYGLFAAV